MQNFKSKNKVNLLGNLGQDPELRYTKNDKAVCNFTIATTDSWGENETTDWHKIVAWGKTGENCEKYLSKGSKVDIEGKLKTRSWQDNEGKKHYVTEIHVENIIFLDNRNTSSAETTTQGEWEEPEDDDLPF